MSTHPDPLQSLFQLDPVTGEPYLSLPPPLNNIIITPPRLSDVPALTAHHNNFEIARWLEGTPYPYLTEHAEGWVQGIKRESDDALEALRQAAVDDRGGSLKLIEGCPVRYLRERKEDGSDIFLGDIEIHRCTFPGTEDPEERARLSKENAERPLGDPAIVWCVGDFIASSHFGRGIMTAALKVMLDKWAIPRMGVRRMRVETFKGNIGSIRVFEKNGFVLEKTIDHVETTNKGVTKLGMTVLWKTFEE